LPIAEEPAATHYHRLVGRHAERMRRVAVAGAAGFIVFAVSSAFLEWELAVLLGWDVAAVGFLAAAWDVILRADAERTRTLATREDETRQAATIVPGSSLASLLAVAHTLAAASGKEGWERHAYVAAALLTVVLSWAGVNTLYTLRYADLQYRHGGRGTSVAPRSCTRWCRTSSAR
jgi:uncharacterized membrane protein